MSNNPDMVTNAKLCNKDNVLTILTNAGHRYFKKEAKLKCLPMLVHFNKESLATILSMKDASKHQGGEFRYTQTYKRQTMFLQGETHEVQEVQQLSVFIKPKTIIRDII